MSLREDLERRIRERGVRVEKRIEVVRLLVGDESGDAHPEALEAKRKKLADAVTRAARDVREAIG
jgi:hypothetical protein